MVVGVDQVEGRGSRHFFGKQEAQRAQRPHGQRCLEFRELGGSGVDGRGGQWTGRAIFSQASLLLHASEEAVIISSFPGY